MKIFKVHDYVTLNPPNIVGPYRPEILTHEDGARELGGIFGLLVPGSQVPYHYHRDRESVIIAISGEATEIVEGEEIPIQEGDILFLSAGEKHMTVNRTERDFRYLEFFTYPPVSADFVEVKSPLRA